MSLSLRDDTKLTPGAATAWGVYDERIRTVVVFAICSATAAPLLSATATELTNVFDSLGAVYEAARALEEVKMANGRLPEITSAAQLARARFGDERAADMLKDAWGSPLHIDRASRARLTAIR